MILPAYMKNARVIIFTTLLLAVGFDSEGGKNESPSPTLEGTFKSVPPAAAAEIIRKNENNPFFAILDTRSYMEYIDGHLVDSVNIEQELDSFKSVLSDLDKSMVYLVYSQTGSTNGKLLELMRELGFQTVYTLSGGLTAWREQVYSIEKGSNCCGS